MDLTLYNMIGSDGSWFSPYGWRIRALLSYKQLDVQWVELRASEVAQALEFADTRTTPLLVDRRGNHPELLRDTWSIARHIEAIQPGPEAFPSGLEASIRLFERMLDRAWQLPGFAAWSPDYFSSGVMAGADAEVFRAIVQRATGRSVESNLADQAKLVADFRTRLAPLESQLSDARWLLGSFSHADILLLSVLKCFSTVLRGLDGVLGEAPAFPALRDWYLRVHNECRIGDPY